MYPLAIHLLIIWQCCPQCFSRHEMSLKLFCFYILHRQNHRRKTGVVVLPEELGLVNVSLNQNIFNIHKMALTQSSDFHRGLLNESHFMDISNSLTNIHLPHELFFFFFFWRYLSSRQTKVRLICTSRTQLREHS